MSLRTTLAALLTIVAALAMHADAQAQSSKPLAIQLGIGTALSGNNTGAVSGASFHAGAALALSGTTTLFALPGTEGIDLDYNYASGNGGAINAYGATYTNRISLIPSIAQSLTGKVVPYIGFGVGVFENQVSKRVTSTVADEGLHATPDLTTTSTQSSSTTSLGGKLIAGVNFPGDVFLEASYIISGSSEGVNTDSLDLAVGAHF